MGEISTRQNAKPPASPSLEIARLTAAVKNKIEIDGTTARGEPRCSISSQNALTEGQRSVLSQRRGLLADALTPRLSDREPVADAILEMFYAWPDTRRMDAGKAAATAAKYASVVSDLPLWAITQACDRLTREDRDFPPSSGSLRAAVLRLCQSAQEELVDLRSILSADVYEATEHGEEAKRRVREAADALRMDRPIDPPPKSPEVKLPSAFDAPRAGNTGGGPMRLSDEALASCGRQRPVEREDAA